MKSLLRGLATFLVALFAASAALYALALGYSMVVCHEGAAGWALLEFFVMFFAFPPLLLLYLLVLMWLTWQLPSAFARFGAGRVMGGGLLAFVAMGAIGAGATAVFGIDGRCSIGF